MDEQIEKFSLAIPQEALDTLRSRLHDTRWPDTETVKDWSQGVPLVTAKALIGYWEKNYDWRRCEKMLNEASQYLTSIDGLDIHFLHVKSRHANAMPIILTHGWPGSILEFYKSIKPLVDPESFGGQASDAFHVVIPSLPGYGFSGKPTTTGWGTERIATAWATLMQRLGYNRYVAQGGDWGSSVTVQMGLQRPAGLLGIHINLVSHVPNDIGPNPDAEERATLAELDQHRRWGAGYSGQQSTKPQTLGYGLADSPAGQGMWIYEKLQSWMDCDGDPEKVLSRDEILDNVMIYWLSNSATSSARLYWESFRNRLTAPLDIPVACSIFPREVIRPPRKWAETIFSNIVYWNSPARGGHFAAWEQPSLFVEELRQAFRTMR